MVRCILLIVAFAVTWLAAAALWILLVLIVATILSGPFGWVLIAALIASIMSIALFIWAWNRCAG